MSSWADLAFSNVAEGDGDEGGVVEGPEATPQEAQDVPLPPSGIRDVGGVARGSAASGPDGSPSPVVVGVLQNRVGEGTARRGRRSALLMEAIREVAAPKPKATPEERRARVLANLAHARRQKALKKTPPADLEEPSAGSDLVRAEPSADFRVDVDVLVRLGQPRSGSFSQSPLSLCLENLSPPRDS